MCTTITYMQLLLPASAVVTIVMGSQLTTSCLCLATVLSPLNWQPFPVWLLFSSSSIAIHLQYTVIRTQRWWRALQMRQYTCLWTCVCVCQRWQWSDLINRGVEESIRGVLGAPEAACCVLLNLILLYWRTNWKSVSLSKYSLGWHN